MFETIYIPCMVFTMDIIDCIHLHFLIITDQYSKYIVDEVGIQINGENTQGENIADNGGIKQSFRVSL